MNIIYIVYSCSPNNGTEDKLGWFIPYEVSKKNNVWIITKPDSKEAIEKFQRDNNSKVQVKYCDVSNMTKKIYRGSFYSGRLNIWNRKAKKIVSSICAENNIDVIHQINPVEFRSIGDYGKFGVPFICGPVGGGEYMPLKLMKYAGQGIDKEIIRWIANWFYKIKYIITGRFKRIEKLLFVNEETRRFLIPTKKRDDYLIMTEIGSLPQDKIDIIRNTYFETRFMTAGRLIYRKGFALLLDAIEAIPEEFDIVCTIVGDGPLYNELKARIDSSYILCNRVVLVGKVPFSQMCEYYRQADYFVMPSLRETTGTVILEAMENGVPVITVDMFGAKNLLNSHNAILYRYESLEPKEALKQAILEGIRKKGQFDKRTIITESKKFSFESKAQEFERLYKEIKQKNYKSKS